MKSQTLSKDTLITLESLELEAKNCFNCDLSKTRHNVVFGSGSKTSKILFIGEAPGKDEDQSGKPFVGRAGKLLDEIFFSIGFSRENLYITNTVKCRPPDNRNPTSSEISACSNFLDNQIDLISPDIIILLGKVAAERLLNTSEPMASLRGKVHSYRKRYSVLVFYHPAYLLRSPSEKIKVWEDILYEKYYKCQLIN